MRKLSEFLEEFGDTYESSAFGVYFVCSEYLEKLFPEVANFRYVQLEVSDKWMKNSIHFEISSVGSRVYFDTAYYDMVEEPVIDVYHALYKLCKSVCNLSLGERATVYLRVWCYNEKPS